MGQQANDVSDEKQTDTAVDRAMAFIKSNKIAVIGKSYCPYCKKVYDLLDKKKSEYGEYAVMNIDKLGNKEMNEIQDHMEKITGARSVPRVFIGGSCIGGCDDTLALDRDGK